MIDLFPLPQHVVELGPGGSATPAVVERWGREASGAAGALRARFHSVVPGGRLPEEGYLLATGPAGAVIIASDPAGERRARQTLRQLPQAPGAAPRFAVADWPVMAWRGLHVLDGGAASLPALTRLVREVLAPAKCNVLIHEIDYAFRFASHPEVADGDAWSVEQVRELVDVCAAEGIRVIPQMNCFGHQSWKEPPGALLRAHPEFEEPPDGRTPQSTLGSPDFYCRSWCPRHPGLHPLVFDLVDELLAAYRADAFHAGMDEVFVIASKACPRCRNRTPAELFADEVIRFRNHLKRRDASLLIWADRLLDGRATGYGAWEASQNRTQSAIAKIPRDVILCDWHYEPRESYPSLGLFLTRGFRVWPTVWKQPETAKVFLAQARATRHPRLLGALATIWYPAPRMAAALIPGLRGGDRIGADTLATARQAVAVIASGWNPGP